MKIEKKQTIQLINGNISFLNEDEISRISGGGFLGLLEDAACFIVSPALGLFNLGIKAGYKEAASK